MTLWIDWGPSAREINFGQESKTMDYDATVGAAAMRPWVDAAVADAEAAQAAAAQSAADAQLALQAQFLTQDEGVAALVGTAAGPKTRQALDARFAPVPKKGPLAAWHAALTNPDLPAPIVWVGSSTTYGLSATNPFAPYTVRVTRACQAAYPSGIAGYEHQQENLGDGYPTRDLNPGVQSYISAAGGATSRNYVNSTNQPFINWYRPGLVVHMIGSNDSLDNPTYAVPVEEYEANVRAAVTAINDGAVNYPLSHMFVHTFRRSGVSVQKWGTYLAALRRIEADFGNVLVVDISEEYERLDAMGADKWGLIDSDGTHQTDAGHALMADLILRAMGIPNAGPESRLVLKDTFTRPNGPLDFVEYPGSRAWTKHSTTSVVTIDRRATFSAAGTVTVDTGLSDIEVECLITTTGVRMMPGLVFRCSNDFNRMGLFLNGQASLVSLYTTIGGTASVPQQKVKALPAGDYRLRVIAQGNRVYGYVNGEKLIDYTMTEAEMTALGSNTSIGFRNSTLTDTAYWRGFAAYRL